MNKQQIFDTVTNHLLTQMKRSVDHEGNDGICMYRGPNDTKCAIGALIPDSSYNEDMEGGVTQLIREVEAGFWPQLDKTLFNTSNIDFLYQLQRIHDDQEPEDWKDSLEQFAEDNNLIFNGVIE